MTRQYGSKTKKIIITSILLSIIFVILSIISAFAMPSYFESLLLLAAIFLFLSILIYGVIYKQFEKLEEIAKDIEKEK